VGYWSEDRLNETVKDMNTNVCGTVELSDATVNEENRRYVEQWFPYPKTIEEFFPVSSAMPQIPSTSTLEEDLARRDQLVKQLADRRRQGAAPSPVNPRRDFKEGDTVYIPQDWAKKLAHLRPGSTRPVISRMNSGENVVEVKVPTQRGDVYIDVQINPSLLEANPQVDSSVEYAYMRKWGIHPKVTVGDVVCLIEDNQSAYGTNLVERHGEGKVGKIARINMRDFVVDLDPVDSTDIEPWTSSISKTIERVPFNCLLREDMRAIHVRPSDYPWYGESVLIKSGEHRGKEGVIAKVIGDAASFGRMTGRYKVELGQFQGVTLIEVEASEVSPNPASGNRKNLKGGSKKVYKSKKRKNSRTKKRKK
jgi:hypothetical protein